MKRVFDVVFSLLGLIFLSPLILVAAITIWLQDFKSPFYVSERVGKDNKLFKMYKLRSMVIGADKLGASSSTAEDVRVTKIGRLIRKFKLDELCQLFNVLKGDMSLVGPRPNVIKNGVELYTEEEMRLLSVKPGITDFASIVFSDEAEILKGSVDPDGDYNRLIRPWKSLLGLMYIKHQEVMLDFHLLLLTAATLFSKPLALKEVNKLLSKLHADPELIEVCLRKVSLSDVVVRKTNISQSFSVSTLINLLICTEAE